MEHFDKGASPPSECVSAKLVAMNADDIGPHVCIVTCHVAFSVVSFAMVKFGSTKILVPLHAPVQPTNVHSNFLSRKILMRSPIEVRELTVSIAPTC